MKTLVVYYSYDGNCALVAENLKSCLGAELLELKLADEKRRRGAALMFWGVYQAMAKKKPPLKPYTVNPVDFDLIILGTPVWAGSPVPAMRSFLDKAKLDGKKLALFCCHGGGMGKATQKLRELLAGAAVSGEIDFAQTKKIPAQELKQKIEAWAKSLAN